MAGWTVRTGELRSLSPADLVRCGLRTGAAGRRWPAPLPPPGPTPMRPAVRPASARAERRSGRAAEGGARAGGVGGGPDPAVPGGGGAGRCANPETGHPEPSPPSPRANTETGDRSSLRLVGAGTATGDPVPVATIGAEGSALSSDLESEGPAATATPGCA